MGCFESKESVEEFEFCGQVDQQDHIKDNPETGFSGFEGTLESGGFVDGGAGGACGGCGGCGA